MRLMRLGEIVKYEVKRQRVNVRIDLLGEGIGQACEPADRNLLTDELISLVCAPAGSAEHTTLCTGWLRANIKPSIETGRHPK
jgi:hypothetical protein